MKRFKNIKSRIINIGKNVFISPTANISGLNGNFANNITIGDNTFIGDNVQIFVNDLVVGDYCKIHNHSTLHGYKPLHIGHNCWVGQGTIIDSIGGTSIGNNCGIGAYSQLWSHIRWGDPIAGCNYNSSSKLIIGNDVWFVGHCIVSPIIAQDFSMALVGSVITKNMEMNHIYGGVPAVDLTGKIPSQVKPIDLNQKLVILKKYKLSKNIKIITNKCEIVDENISYFNIDDRTYTKRSTKEEISFMKRLQLDLIKFVPL